MKKRIVTLLLSAALVTSALFTGCSQNDVNKVADEVAQNIDIPDVSVDDVIDGAEKLADTVETELDNAGVDVSITEDGVNVTLSQDSDAEGIVIGEGETEFTFEVVDVDGNTTMFQVNTDETTVGAALVNLDLIAGDESEYGLYVKTVNGVTVDYDTDGKYWAFYIDGEYASTGVDSTDITAGSTYSFKVE